MLSAANVVFLIYSVFYPYLASYLKLTDPSFTMKTLFSYFLLAYVGFGFASQFTNAYLYLFGFKNAIMINGFVNILHNFGFAYLKSRAGIAICTILMGSTSEVTLILCTLFFKEHYPKDAEIHYTKCSGGKMFGTAFWTIALAYLVNPNNKGLEWEVEENGIVNRYYSQEISQNIVSALFYNSIYVAIIYVAVLFYIPKSNIYKGLEIMRLRKNSCTEHLDEFNDSRELMISAMNENRASETNNSKNPFRLKNEGVIGEDWEQMEENLLTKEADDFSYSKEIVSQKFLILFMLSIIRLSENNFIIDNYKLQGAALTDNDHLLNQVFAFAGFLSFFSRTYSGLLWEKLGSRKVHTIILIITVLIDLTYIFLVEHSFYVYALSVCIVRPLNQFNLLLSVLVLYSNYKPKIALRLSMVFDLTYILPIIMVVLLNQYLVIGTHYRPVYMFYLAIDSFGLFIVRKYIY